MNPQPKTPEEKAAAERRAQWAAVGMVLFVCVGVPALYLVTFLWMKSATAAPVTKPASGSGAGVVVAVGGILSLISAFAWMERANRRASKKGDALPTRPQMEQRPDGQPALSQPAQSRRPNGIPLILAYRFKGREEEYPPYPFADILRHRKDLREINLAGVELRTIELEYYWLNRAILRDADLESARMRSAHLDGADLSGANLRWANLSSASLGGACLKGANLRAADLQNADLRGANLEGAELKGACLKGAILRGANLGGANLEEAYLRWADIRGADLRGARLGGADIIHLRWKDVLIPAQEQFDAAYYNAWTKLPEGIINRAAEAGSKTWNLKEPEDPDD